MSFIQNAFAATTTASTTTSTQHAPSMVPMVVVLVVIVLFYVWLWRQQSKKTQTHQKLVNGLKKGDEVVTNGGMLGKVNRVEDQFVGLYVSKELEIMVQKSAISQVLPKGTVKHF